MNNYIQKNTKATVCADKTCITVYGKTAELVNSLTQVIMVLGMIYYLSKLLK